MQVGNVTINEMKAQILSEARRLGFSEATIWRHWLPKIDIIAKFYRNKGLCFYDPAVTEEFIQKCKDRFHVIIPIFTPSNNFGGVIYVHHGICYPEFSLHNPGHSWHFSNFSG